MLLIAELSLKVTREELINFQQCKKYIFLIFNEDELFLQFHPPTSAL
jgi:hypothetical protein